jgi:hypothetical protein
MEHLEQIFFMLSLWRLSSQLPLHDADHVGYLERTSQVAIVTHHKMERTSKLNCNHQSFCSLVARNPTDPRAATRNKNQDKQIMTA